MKLNIDFTMFALIVLLCVGLVMAQAPFCIQYDLHSMSFQGVWQGVNIAGESMWHSSFAFFQQLRFLLGLRSTRLPKSMGSSPNRCPMAALHSKRYSASSYIARTFLILLFYGKKTCTPRFSLPTKRMEFVWWKYDSYHSIFFFFFLFFYHYQQIANGTTPFPGLCAGQGLYRCRDFFFFNNFIE